VTVLAAGEVSPGLLGFVVVAVLGFALYMLIKSMNKQMSKIQVPREHEQDTDQAEPAQASAQASGNAARGADDKGGE
jgi:hypothetical protein